MAGNDYEIKMNILVKVTDDDTAIDKRAHAVINSNIISHMYKNGTRSRCFLITKAERPKNVSMWYYVTQSKGPIKRSKHALSQRKKLE